MTDFQTIADRIAYNADRTAYPDLPGLSVVSNPARRGLSMPDSAALLNLLTRTVRREATEFDDISIIHKLNVHEQPLFFGQLTDAIGAAAAQTGFTTSPRQPISRGNMVVIVGPIDYHAYSLTGRIQPGDTATVITRAEEEAWPDTPMWEVEFLTGRSTGENWLLPESNLQVTS